MKRILLVAIAVVMSVGQMLAAPVDVVTAKSVGDKFVKTNIKSFRNFKASELVYTLNDDNGNACLYVFNVDDKGFYVVSADDRATPILAYSEESVFDVNRIPEGLNYYLNNYKDAISYVIVNDLEADDAATAEWNLLKTRGVLSRRTDRSVEPLIDLLWDQEYPYNYYCPTVQYGPGGHAYAGCVADAMAMIMKFWNYPDAGVGEHSYTPDGFPTQTVVYGEAYDWDNMPKQLTSSSPMNQIHAVATLMYHCGVSVDMQYGASASGTYSSLVTKAMSTNFKYDDNISYLDKRDYNRDDWENMLMDSFDQGLPVLYGGYSEQSGGHAFVCDGYDENRMFHFNWGWSGFSNGYFAVDALNPYVYNFTDEQNAVINIMPDYVYEAMPAAPVVETEKENAYSYKGYVTVILPSATEDGAALTSLDRLVIMRGDEVVYSEDNPAPGDVVVIEDVVEDFDAYTYRAYVVNDGVKGRLGEAILQYGPTCEWRLIGMSTYFHGWNGAKLKFLNANGNLFEEITLKTSAAVSETIQMPEGEVTLVWVAPKSEVQSVTIRLKDPSNETIYSFTGPSSGIQEGEILTVDNTCEDCKAPENLTAEMAVVDEQYGALIKWEYDGTPQSYNVYRSSDNDDYQLIATVNEKEYFDPVNGGYYYQVTAYRSGCESTPAMTSDNERDYVYVDITGIKENFIGAKVFPNPTSGMLNIKVDGLSHVSVYNAVGQMLMQHDVDTDEYVLDMKHLEDGVYMIRIVSKNGETTQRITIID